jgi:hypothetical protein
MCDDRSCERAIKRRGWTPLFAGALGLIFSALFLRWQLIDRTPPSWDEGLYLLDTWIEWNALHHGGLLAFYDAFLTTDPGRVGLLPLMGVLGFEIGGPSVKAALMPFAALWVLAIVCMFDFTANAGEYLLGLDTRRAGIAGLLAGLFFATYPLTQYVALGYYVEFPLMTAIAALNAAALRYWLTGSLRWAFAIGLVLALGLLCKVTFPAFALAGVGLTVWRLASNRSLRRMITALATIALPVLVIPTPFYVKNAAAIAELTAWLSSAGLASVYGLGGGLDSAAILKFLLNLTSLYEFSLCALLACILLIWTATCRPLRAVTAAALILASTAAPLFVVATSNFKLERYAHPGFIGLFVLAGLGLALPWRWPKLAAPLTMVLLLAPIAKIAATYTVLPESALQPLAALQSRLGWLNVAVKVRSPDPRDWHIDDLVAATETLPGPIIMLGGSAAFHQALLQFTSRAHGGHQDYQGFIYQIYPNFTDADMLRFLDEHHSSPVLYKSPPYPLFLGNGVAAGLAALSQRDDLVRTELPFTQPDGSRFILFLPKKSGP